MAAFESSRSGYEFFEHTADVGLRAYGSSLTELFTHAAQGMAALLVERNQAGSRDTRALALQADSVDALLRAWLKELLFWFQTERFVASVYHIDRITLTEIRARVHGGTFNPDRDAPGTEIKGLTFHQFRVNHVRDGWEAELIFDV